MALKFVLVILLSCYFASAAGQLTPEERCTTEVTGPICNSCNGYIECKNGLLSTTDEVSCNNTMEGTIGICDMNFIDGSCRSNLLSSQSPICMCETFGCFTDPNNPKFHVMCDVPDTQGLVIPECDSTAPYFNTSICECTSYPTACPGCEAIGIEGSNDDCLKSYVYCAGPNSGITFLCTENECYNSSSCECEEIPFDCPAECGKYKDPDGSDKFCSSNDNGYECDQSCLEGEIFDEDRCDCVADCPEDCPMKSDVDSGDATKYCFCEPGTDYVCGLQCRGGEIFSDAVCGCVLVATTTPPRIVQCQSCGVYGSTDDCREYYQCNSNGEQISGPYFCPVGYCLNEAECACIKESK